MLYLSENITANFLILSLTILLLCGILGSYIYGIYKKITTKDFSIVRIILSSVLPLTIGIILISLWAWKTEKDIWYIYFFGWLYAFSPFILFLSGFIKNRASLVSRILDIGKKYIVAFLIGIAIFLPIFFLGQIFDELRYNHLWEIIIVGFFFLCGYSLSVWFILTYAWMEIEDISLTSWRAILRSAVALAFIFIVIWLSPNWKNLFIDTQIEKAYSILQKDGYTQEWIEKAAKIRWLKWALEEKYLERTLYPNQKDLYAKLYDTTLESEIDTELDVDKYKSRTSNATSMLAQWANAKVELNFAKHETEILSDIGAAKTTLTYEFQNTSTTNQEVVFSILLPNTESVMTDLKLGINLEYTGAIAPRGAAAKVYQDSLRRNTDPALLEQTGPLSYRLRVFPVLSNTDPKTQWRQRVQISYLTPLSSDGTLTTIPKTEILNLKLTPKSEILTRVTEWEKALLQDSKKSEKISILTEGKIEKLDIKKEKSLENFCHANTYSGINMELFSTPSKKFTKNIVFFDISKSMSKKSHTKKQYQSLIDGWKNNGVSLDVYGYNFEVYSYGYNIEDVEFWGSTDMSKIIDFIDKNAITWANIVIVTDDNSYEQANTELRSLDYKKLKSNRISLIQIGDKVRTLKTEISKALLATDGTLLIIEEDAPISDSAKALFTEKKAQDACISYTWSSLDSLRSLQGYQDGRRVFWESLTSTGRAIRDTRGFPIDSTTSTTREYIETRILSDMEILERIAIETHIVTQATSLIALETEWQKQNLDIYSQQSDRYETKYENFSNDGQVTTTRRGIRPMEMERAMAPQSIGASNANMMFGTAKSTSLSVSSDTLWGMSNWSISWGYSSSAKASMVQYIIAIVLFPLIAWFVLRRKPKSEIESPQKKEKKSE
jgi:hypothetical protein